MCTFEADTCGFVDDPTGRFNWTRHRGSTVSSGTGPSSDHTKGTSAGQLSEISSSICCTIDGNVDFFCKRPFRLICYCHAFGFSESNSAVFAKSIH